MKTTDKFTEDMAYLVGFSPYGFQLVGPDGITEQSGNGGYGCMAQNETLPSGPYAPSSQYTGKVVLDSRNATRGDPSSGWRRLSLVGVVFLIPNSLSECSRALFELPRPWLCGTKVTPHAGRFTRPSRTPPICGVQPSRVSAKTTTCCQSHPYPPVSYPSTRRGLIVCYAPFT